MEDTQETQIARRAYELWEKAGRPETRTKNSISGREGIAERRSARSEAMRTYALKHGMWMHI